MKANFFARFALFTLMVVSFTASPGQNISIQWGPRYPIRNGEQPIALIPSGKNYFTQILATNHRTETFVIQRIRLDSLSPERIKVFTPPEELQRADLTNLLQLKKELVWFFELYNKKEKSAELYAIRTDSTFEVIGNPMLIDNFNLPSRREAGNFLVEMSTDSTHFAVLHQSPPDSRQTEKISLSVFDPDLKISWHQQVQVPYPEEQFKVQQIALDSSLNFHFIASVGNVGIGNKPKDNGLGSKFVYFSFNHQTNTLHDLALDLGQKWVLNAFLKALSGNRISIAGFYSNIADLRIAGAFQLVLDGATSRPIERGLSPIDRDFMESLRDNGNTALGSEEINLYKPLGILYHPDGSISLSAEKRFVTSSAVFNPNTGMQSIYYQYNYNRVISIRVDPDGKITQARKIEKLQIANNKSSTFYSASPYAMGNATVFLYNDNTDNYPDPGKEQPKTKNKDTEDLQVMDNPQKSAAVMAYLGKSGIPRINELFLANDEGLIMVPGFALPIGENRMVIFLEGQGSWAYCKVKYKL